MILKCGQNSRNNINIMQTQPADAKAEVKGSHSYPEVKGIVCFYQTKMGVLVSADISGLPNNSDVCDSKIFGFHLHEGSSCTGNEKDPFADTGMHYNPKNCKHPYHAGDFPPLFENEGTAYMVFLTNRFKVRDVLGRTVVIHSDPDDFKTQPSGNSGTKIACGKIRR